MSRKITIEDALCFNLYSASRAMTQAYRPYLKEIGLTYPQFLVMNILWEDTEKYPTLKSLGNRLYLDSGTLTPLITRLQKMNLLKKERSHNDEREIFIKLTSKGIQLQKRSEEIPGQMFCSLDVSMERFEEIRDGVKEILSNLHRNKKS